ncbi:YeeE/YedE family protein [Candidatus Igneacidithiobacillus taiwanensis]|nr:YeeE/YedE family protein [Candidatus Igneacidithiobacillus taiwanensis]MCE5359585.1 YeeE/YedE family protein [Acidithiobacillus sp.]
MWTDIATFDPWTSFFGGILIGLAAVLLLAVNGKIAGISGILGGLFTARGADVGWRIAFIAGLIASPLLLRLTHFDNTVDDVNGTLTALLLGGFLVGFGARLGSGCTSGHGVVGLSRLSRRSIVATLSFMTAGFLVVNLVRHVL